MAGALLRLCHGVGQCPVDRPALPDRGLHVADRRQQWMDESHSCVGELDDVLSDSGLERPDDPFAIAVRGRDQLDGRSSKRGHLK